MQIVVATGVSSRRSRTCQLPQVVQERPLVPERREPARARAHLQALVRSDG